MFVRAAIANTVPDLFERLGDDLVDGIARLKVTLDLLVAPRCFKLADQVAGADHFFAEAANYFDRARIHH